MPTINTRGKTFIQPRGGSGKRSLSAADRVNVLKRQRARGRAATRPANPQGSTTATAAPRPQAPPPDAANMNREELVGSFERGEMSKGQMMAIRQRQERELRKQKRELGVKQKQARAGLTPREWALVNGEQGFDAQGKLTPGAEFELTQKRMESRQERVNLLKDAMNQRLKKTQGIRDEEDAIAFGPEKRHPIEFRSNAVGQGGGSVSGLTGGPNRRFVGATGPVSGLDVLKGSQARNRRAALAEVGKRHEQMMSGNRDLQAKIGGLEDQIARDSAPGSIDKLLDSRTIRGGPTDVGPITAEMAERRQAERARISALPRTKRASNTLHPDRVAIQGRAQELQTLVDAGLTPGMRDRAVRVADERLRRKPEPVDPHADIRHMSPEDQADVIHKRMLDKKIEHDLANAPGKELAAKQQALIKSYEREIEKLNQEMNDLILKVDLDNPQPILTDRLNSMRVRMNEIQDKLAEARQLFSAGVQGEAERQAIQGGNDAMNAHLRALMPDEWERAVQGDEVARNAIIKAEEDIRRRHSQTQ